MKRERRVHYDCIPPEKKGPSGFVLSWCGIEQWHATTLVYPTLTRDPLQVTCKRCMKAPIA